MAILKVKYIVEVTELIDWPDDELKDLNYENLEINLDFKKGNIFEQGDIVSMHKNGEEFYF